MTTRPPRRLVETIRLLAGQKPLDPADPLRAALIEKLQAAVLHPNVIGFGISEKRREGVPTGTLGITFYVERKVPLRELGADERLPELLVDAQGRAIHTDIVEVGRVEAHAQATVTPIRSGFSVGHAAGPPGTVAALVVRNGKPHLLSAQHVLANFDGGAAGDQIHYPAIGDGGGAHRAGSLLAYTPLDPAPGFPNRVDAALCALTEAAAARIDPSVPGAAQPLRAGTAQQNMVVQWSGRTSGVATSVVRGVMVQASLLHGTTKFGFRDQILCEGQSEGGDSGSLVVASESGEVIGMLIGGAAHFSFVTPIRAVLEALHCRFGN